MLRWSWIPGIHQLTWSSSDRPPLRQSYSAVFQLRLIHLGELIHIQGNVAINKPQSKTGWSSHGLWGEFWNAPTTFGCAKPFVRLCGGRRAYKCLQAVTTVSYITSCTSTFVELIQYVSNIHNKIRLFGMGPLLQQLLYTHICKANARTRFKTMSMAAEWYATVIFIYFFLLLLLFEKKKTKKQKKKRGSLYFSLLNRTRQIRKLEREVNF